MSQPPSLSGKKLISRSLNNPNNLLNSLNSQQRSSRQKLNQVTNSLNTSQQISYTTSQPYNSISQQQSNKVQQQSRTQLQSSRSQQQFSNIQQPSLRASQHSRTEQQKGSKTEQPRASKQPRTNKSASKQQQKDQKNIFYSELHIETNDIDVPLVKILKVNQELLKKFIYYSTSIQSLMQLVKIRSMNLGFRAIATNLIKSQRFNLKISRIAQTLTKLIRTRLQLGMIKLSALKNKQKVKQKGLVVLNRLVISKMQINYRWFFKNCSQKKLINMVLNKVEQDQLLKMKMNLEIFKQITFSKQFILKCRPLIKYNKSNKTLFEKELLKNNFEESLKIQLERYEKIRQNVDSRNPMNDSKAELNKSSVKRKPLASQPIYYQNQVVLMAIKSFNLSLIDTRASYQQKITSLNQHITDLQNQERYVQLEGRLNLSDSNNKAYESVITEFYSRADEEIRKILAQYPLEKNQQLLKKKLLPVIVSQKTKYLKSSQRHQKQFQSSQKPTDDYLSKLYKSRCFSLQFCYQLLNAEEKVNQFEIYKEVYEFVINNMSELMDFYENQTKLRQFQERLKRSKHELDIQQHSSTIVVNLSECMLALHNRYREEREKFISESNRREEDLKISLTKEKQFRKSQQKIQKVERKTSTSTLNAGSKQLVSPSTLSNNTSRQVELSNKQTNTEQTYILFEQPQKTFQKEIEVEKTQHLFRQPTKTAQRETQAEPIQQAVEQPLITHEKETQSDPTEQDKNAIIDVIRNSIITYIKSTTRNYQNSQSLVIDNMFLKKNLLPETQGKAKIEQNIQINSFVKEINSEVVILVKNLNESLALVSASQLQIQQLAQMISLFYELILSSTSSNQQNSKQLNSSSLNQNSKFNQINKRWIQFCRTKTSSQQKLHFINTFNQIFMLFKQLSSSNNKDIKPQADFTQELKKILKEKLQFQRLYHETQKKYLIKQEQYKIIERQNKEYMKKQMEVEKQLLRLKNQHRDYSEKQQKFQQTIQRLKEQLNLYMNSAKDEAQENNKLNRELSKMKHSVTSLNEQIERLRFRQSQRLKLVQQKQSTTAINKTNYSINEYVKMQTNYKMKLTQLDQSLTQVQSEKFQLNKLIINLKSQLKDIQKISEQQKFQIHRLKQEIQREKSDSSKFVEIQSMYQLQIQRLQNEKDELNRLVSQMQQRIEGQKRQKVLIDKTEYWRLKQYQSANQRLLGSIQSLEGQISGINKQINKLQKQLAQKSKHLLQSKSIHQSHLNKLSSQHQLQLSRLKQFYQSQINQLQHRLRQQQAFHQSLVSQLHKKYEQLNRSTELHNSYSSNSQRQSFTHTHQLTNTHTHELTVLEYDPQKQIKSLKEFIQTLQKQNQKLTAKCRQLKKELYADDTSTVFSQKTTSTKQSHSVQFYQHLIHDLKVENDRLYAEILKVKAVRKGSSQIIDIQQGHDESVNEFWLKEIRRKQESIQQLQNTINELNFRIQSNRQSQQTVRNEFNYHKESTTVRQSQKVVQLQQQLDRMSNHFQFTQSQLQQQLHLLRNKHSLLQKQCQLYKQQLNQQKSCQEQESLKVHFNYSQLLLSTKKVKQLFTSFVEATNAILYKLDRTSQIYLNFEETLNQRRSSLNPRDRIKQYESEELMIKQEQENQAKRAQQSIISLVEEFKTVIQNNHQTLKSIYQNLVCHPYTKTALQLQYLKQLTFTIISKFLSPSLADAFSNGLSSPYEFTSLNAREQLQTEIEAIFNPTTEQRIKPIEEIFVRVEELIVHKIQSSLQNYKKQMHLKAMELDYVRQRLNLVVDHNLTQQQLLINKIPYNHQHNYLQTDFKNNSSSPLHNPFIPHNYSHHHNYQYRQSNHSSQLSQNQHQELKHDSFPQQQQTNQRRPFSGNWISKTSSNYEYRPLTSLIDKYELMNDEKMIDKIPQQEKVVMYRSSVNPYHPNDQLQFNSGRLS